MFRMMSYMLVLPPGLVVNAHVTCFVMPVQKDLTGQPLRELLSESCVSLCLIR